MIPAFSASQLIAKSKKMSFKGKRTGNISNNQRVLVEEVEKLQTEIGDFILDGHMCLINRKGDIECLPEKIFRSLNIEHIEVLVDGPSIIGERLKLRDGEFWNEDLIEKFQNSEVRHAKKISKLLGIDLKIITVQDKERSRESHFEKNIILPIKPNFVEKILNGEKKYEYRKRICIENIDKMYLYATAPVKAILGEAEILVKMTMDKEHLWNVTKDTSGISKEYFNEYFSKSIMASAYRLGKIRCYDFPVTLDEVGISFVPQSHVYVGDLTREKDGLG